MKLKDISNEAGVAISTVSRVLKDPDSSAASPETKEKIFQIALKGGYISEIPGPDPFEEVPAGSQPTKILYCMLAVGPKEREDNPFFTRLMESIRAAAHHYNYITEYYMAESYFPSEGESSSVPVPMDMGKTVRGIIVIGRGLPDFVNELLERFDNIVYIGLTSLDTPCDQIICSGYNASKDIVHLFSAHGHKHIGFIGSHDDDRMKGYLEAMSEEGLSADSSSLVSENTMNYSGGYSGMNTLLDARSEHPVTAVFCSSDNVAIGALQACRERGIRVPEDINIIGMDGSEMTKYLTPSLSTIHVPLEEMGKFAVRVLRDRMHGGHTQPIKVYFPYKVLERDSGPSDR